MEIGSASNPWSYQWVQPLPQVAHALTQEAVERMQQEDVKNFAEQAKREFRDQPDLGDKIHAFFRRASQEQQKWFWDCTDPNDQDVDAFLTYVFTLITSTPDKVLWIPLHAKKQHVDLLRDDIFWIQMRPRDENKQEGAEVRQQEDGGSNDEEQDDDRTLRAATQYVRQWPPCSIQ